MPFTRERPIILDDGTFARNEDGSIAKLTFGKIIGLKPDAPEWAKEEFEEYMELKRNPPVDEYGVAEKL